MLIRTAADAAAEAFMSAAVRSARAEKRQAGMIPMLQEGTNSIAISRPADKAWRGMI